MSLVIETALRTESDVPDGRFFHRYMVLKERVLDHEYEMTMAGFPGGNDHGPQHIKRVLANLDKLTGPKPLRYLNHYELFLAMMGVLYHDIGILRGRKDHAAISAKLLTEDNANYIFNDVDKEFLSAIVLSHSSRADIDKCPIDQPVKGFDVRPRLIAALVRLADELDEDIRRADPLLYKKLDLPKESEFYWRFNRRIRGVKIDSRRSEIIFNVAFHRDDIGFMENGVDGSFIELFFKKIFKVNKERVYCNEYLLPEFTMKEIRIMLQPVEGSGMATDMQLILGDDTEFETVRPQVPELLFGSDSKSKPPRKRSSSILPGPSADNQIISSVAISMNNLPSSREELFGRQQKLKQLDSAWSDPGTNVVSVVASAGVGKSALVNHWLAKMAKNHYRGAARVYAWSFYSQGIRDSTVSADDFIDKALRDFRDTDPTAGSPGEKGERLAHLIRQEKTLLILDGVEPLQNTRGMLKDQELVSLIRALAAANRGLCVITTRCPVADIQHYKKTTAPIIELKPLSSIAGSEFLLALGVRGAKDELQRASIEFGGNALALQLLGTYIRDVCASNVQRRNEVNLLEADAEQGGHASRVMASYEKWFGDGPEIAVLCLLGLFDRRADARAVDVVRKPPAIPGLTDKLERLSELDWRFTLARLRRAKLIAEPNPNGQDDLDTHALVREYFEQQLRKAHPSAWREGHNRLHEYFKMAAPALPDTPVDMAPLFLSVTHGCRAGRYQDTLDGVVKRRILRIQRWDDSERFASKNLGMANSVLSALSSFCGPNWCQPVNELRDEDRARVVFEAGFYLSTQLRPEAAHKALSKALELCEAQHDDTLAGASLGDLSRLNLTLGKIKEAISYAEKAVSLADKSGNLFRRMEVRTYLASALHQAGRYDVAEAVFRDAEDVQKERHRLEPQVQPPLLWSFQGWLYCDLLLDQGKYIEVKARAEQTLSWATQKKRLADIALDHLSLGRAHLLEVQHDKAGEFSEASKHLDDAVNELQEAGERQHLPRALLARAEAYRMRNNFKNAKRDLDAAMDIVGYVNMDLFKADIQLGYARIYLAMGKKDEARKRLAVGQDLISRMGYSRRDNDVEELTQQL